MISAGACRIGGRPGRSRRRGDHRTKASGNGERSHRPGSWCAPMIHRVSHCECKRQAIKGDRTIYKSGEGGRKKAPGDSHRALYGPTERSIRDPSIHATAALSRRLRAGISKLVRPRGRLDAFDVLRALLLLSKVVPRPSLAAFVPDHGRSSIHAGAWSLARARPRTSRSTPAASRRSASGGLRRK